MVALADRLAIPNGPRYGWLQTNDTYLLCELNNIFGKELFIRGAVESKQKGSEKANEYFDKHLEVDYFIYSTDAPTQCDLVYVEKSRILFYRPSKTWSRGRSGRSHFRPASCRFVRLKRQILTIFDEELYIKK
jgi:hypothetical protein